MKHGIALLTILLQPGVQVTEELNMSCFLRRLVVGTCISSVVFGCQPYEPEWRAMLPGGKASLVVVLKSGNTYQEIRRFQEEELVVGHFEQGHWHRPGIDLMMQLPIDGHEAFVVIFDPSAPAEEREAIRAGVKTSPYVYRVFGDVNPWELKLNEEPEGEAAENANGA